MSRRWSGRCGFPDIPRRVSGYNLDSLLPEKGFDLARALVGSEGTLVTVLRAELALVPVPAYESMVVLGYDDICAAADDVPRLLAHSEPELLEAMDGRMAQLMREEGAHREAAGQPGDVGGVGGLRRCPGPAR